MRTLALGLLLAASGRGAEGPQIDWALSFEAAFRDAKESGRPVMVCINSRDGESANEATATEIYRDPLFVAATRRFVMVLVSTRNHANEGACPRFGKVTCKQHLDCWTGLNAKYGPQFVVPGTTDEMISPQHAWFAPDGKLLRRKEYFLGKRELMRMMKTALAEAGTGAATGAPAADAGLTDGDRSELARLANAADKEARAAALGNLLATGKDSVHGALLETLSTTKNVALKGEILRALAEAQAPGVRAAAEKLLGDADPLARSFAAVALEQLGEAESIPVLVKRARAEDDTLARKNVVRALGVCGGASGDKGAAKALLDAATGDKQKVVCKHAALALRAYAGEGAAVVRKKLEQAALAAKDPDVRHGLVYALAYVGDQKTTIPALEKILAMEHDESGRGLVRGAIARIKGVSAEGGEDRFAESAKWLFSEDREDPARAES